MHSEEHLVIETSMSGRLTVGQVVYGIPWHICPTTALHKQVYVISAGRLVARWDVAARDRWLTI